MAKSIKYEIGQKIGTYTIVDIVNERKKYLVKCECGKSTAYQAFYLNKSPRCAQCRINSLIGTKNHKTTFLKYLGKQNFLCSCDCGKEFIGRERQKSCGCHIQENLTNSAKKLNGLSFYAIKNVQFSHFQKSSDGKHNDSIYTAECRCGKKFFIKRSQIFKNKTCGCRILNSHARGESQWNNKYDANIISCVRELYLSGEYTRQDLSEMLNLPYSAVTDFLSMKSWTHIPVPEKIIKKSRVKDKFARRIKKIEIGEKYSHWTVLALLPSSNTHGYVLCQCTCGQIKRVLASALRVRKSTKCYDCNAKNFANLRKKI